MPSCVRFRLSRAPAEFSSSVPWKRQRRPGRRWLQERKQLSGRRDDPSPTPRIAGSGTGRKLGGSHLLATMAPTSARALPEDRLDLGPASQSVRAEPVPSGSGGLAIGATDSRKSRPASQLGCKPASGYVSPCRADHSPGKSSRARKRQIAIKPGACWPVEVRITHEIWPLAVVAQVVNWPYRPSFVGFRC